MLDGEIAIFDQQLRSGLDRLRGQPDELATPPMYIAFDVLYRASGDISNWPLRDRRIVLEDVLSGASNMVLPARRLADNGLDAWAQEKLARALGVKLAGCWSDARRQSNGHRWRGENAWAPVESCGSSRPSACPGGPWSSAHPGATGSAGAGVLVRLNARAVMICET